MECKIFLHCNFPTEDITIETRYLKESASSEAHISSNSRLYENGHYSASVEIAIPLTEIAKVKLYLNGLLIGSAIEYVHAHGDKGTCATIIFEGGQRASQPFLLQYDLIQLYVSVEKSDGSIFDFISDYHLCLSKHQADVDNVNAIMQALFVFDDDKIQRWIFASSEEEKKANTLTEGSWRDRSYKSLHSYLQLIEEVYTCYKNNLAYYKILAKDNIVITRVLRSYEKVRTVKPADFDWLMQNADQLVQISRQTSISYNGKYYIPSRMITEEKKRNSDVYENRVLVSFLDLVCSHAKNIEMELSKSMANEKNLLGRLQGLEQGGFKSLILTAKRFQINLHQGILERLNLINRQLQTVYTQYKAIFPYQQTQLTKFPRKTKTFQEIRPYAQVFEQIIHWFRYGEYDLRKENVILRVKTIDKLFEFYCLHRILQMVTSAGFDIDESQRSIYSYKYRVADPNYSHESDIANTFVLSRGTTTLTVYYQPVINTSQIENNITLFRTTCINNYFMPDFLLKITKGNTGISDYVLLDSKYSTRRTIQEYEMDKEILRYSCQIADTSGRSDAVKMVWLLQGRVDDTNNVFAYHNSPLAKRYPPTPSYGIISVNTQNSNLRGLWDEITYHIGLNNPRVVRVLPQ